MNASPAQPTQPTQLVGPDTEPEPGPLVSIVLPVHNGATFLGQAIESVIAQTYPGWELIIVDDASTDETPTIIEAFIQRDARIRCLRHQINARLPGALNAGFRLARGEYLTWTSDDNRYRADAIAAMAQALTHDAETSFVYADYEIIDAAGQFVEAQTVGEATGLIQGQHALPCFLYRRQIYEHIGGYAEDLFLAEDYDYWLRVLAAGYHMCPLHRTLYEYRRHPRSLTDVYRGRTFAAAECSLLRHLPRMARISPAQRSRAYLYLASLASWQGAYGRTLRYTLRAVPGAPLRAGHQTLAFVVRRMHGVLVSLFGWVRRNTSPHCSA